jgi:hypothetical protein
MKKIRLSILLLFIALIGTPVLVFAQGQPSADALQGAQRLISLMSPNIIDQISTQMTNLSWPSFEAEFRAKYPNISPDPLKALRAELHKLDNAYVTEMLLKDAPGIYARFFTADELRQLIAFYQTSTGAKSLQVMPSISAQFSALSIARLPSIKERIDAAMNAILRVYGYVP